MHALRVKFKKTNNTTTKLLLEPILSVWGWEWTVFDWTELYELEWIGLPYIELDEIDWIGLAWTGPDLIVFSQPAEFN